MIAEDQMIHMVVIDKDPMFALGLCSLLEKRLSISASAFAPVDLLQAGPDHRYTDQAASRVDIALLDPAQIDLPAGHLAKRLRERFGARCLISYTNDLSMTLARASLAAGFRGVLPRSAGLEQLEAAIMAVHGGATCIDPAFANLFDSVQTAKSVPRQRELTEREIYVLKSVAFGKSLKEIGLELELSSKTIETYKARGSSKLNLQGRRAIVEYAIRNGWVQSEKRTA
ncbi:MAG: response regulator transcription factor [Cypionkella sp.]|uniref:helix-turn-helix transcriptional regulator n=1 Tax=Cypionkella sp. TaxID=2811411 RepID=UPI002AB91ED5|nr:response regulator transcription factor [Cypionkella sp.]MDZ4310526.1 response regulator transcription factor [Cypionkella sp.]